jgi:hypothetical protein
MSSNNVEANVIYFSIPGEKAKAKIFIAQLSRLDQSSLQFNLVNKDGTNISPLMLNDSTITFDLPADETFKLRLTGNIRDVERFMRTSRVIRPQAAIIRAQILEDLQTIKRGKISYFRALIDHMADEDMVFTVTGSSPTPGVFLTMRRSVRVRKSRPGFIPVFVVTRLSVPAGTVAKIQITAKSGDVSINLLSNLMVI